MASSSSSADSQSFCPLDALVSAASHPAAIKVGISVATHPVEYAKVLIQLGHEPIAPRQTRTLLGKPALALPSVFQYMGHIRRKDGFFGLYRGLTPKILELGLSSVTADKFDAHCPPTALEAKPDEECSEEEKLEKVVRVTLRDISRRLVCVVVTQPLHVIAIRSMAQFIGGEEKYSGVFSGVCSVYQDSGVLGFWAGLMPRAIGESAMLGLSAAVTFLINKYAIEDKDMARYTSHIAGFLASSLCYPFTVVSHCMSVSRSGLAAGYPPHMPFYTSSLDCARHLNKEKQLKRGASLLFRYYTGPQVIVGDRVMAVNSSSFKFEPSRK